MRRRQADDQIPPWRQRHHKSLIARSSIFCSDDDESLGKCLSRHSPVPAGCEQISALARRAVQIFSSVSHEENTNEYFLHRWRSGGCDFRRGLSRSAHLTTLNRHVILCRSRMLARFCGFYTRCGATLAFLRRPAAAPCRRYGLESDNAKPCRSTALIASARSDAASSVPLLGWAHLPASVPGTGLSPW